MNYDIWKICINRLSRYNLNYVTCVNMLSQYIIIFDIWICQQALTIQYKLSLISEICQQALTVQQTAPLTEMGMVRIAQSVWTRQPQTVGSTPRDSPQRCHRWMKTPRGRRKVSDDIYKIKRVFILCLIPFLSLA